MKREVLAMFISVVGGRCRVVQFMAGIYALLRTYHIYFANDDSGTMNPTMQPLLRETVSL